MGILSNLAYAATSGIFDILKSQLYANQVAGRTEKGQVLKSLIESMEGQEPTSPGAMALAGKIKELTGIEWPQIQQEMPIPGAAVTPELSELARGAEGRLPSAIPGGLPILAQAPPAIPTRTGLAALPPISPEKLLARAVQSGDQETIDRLAFAKGIPQKLDIALQEQQRKLAELSQKKTLAEQKNELLRERMGIHKDIAEGTQLYRDRQLAEKQRQFELTQKRLEGKEYRTGLAGAMTNINKLLWEVNRLAAAKEKPEVIQQAINKAHTTIQQIGKKYPEVLDAYQNLKPLREGPGTLEGLGLWKTEPESRKIIGYDLSALPDPESMLTAPVEEAGGAGGYKDTGETTTIGGKKYKVVIDPVTGKKGILK